MPDGQGPDGGAGADAGLPANAKLVFVTRATYRGDMGGVAGADSKCNAAAAGGSLPGAYHAWISAYASNAIDHVTGTGPWYTPTGVKIFANHAALASSPLVEIAVGEDGSEVLSDRVWTGTSAGGTADGIGDSDFCYAWGNQGGTGTAGNTGSSDGGWTSLEPNVPCNNTGHLYCFQQ